MIPGEVSAKKLPLSLLAIALLFCAVCASQPLGPARDPGQAGLTRLSGNIPSLARVEFDQGQAAPSTVLRHVRLVLAHTAEQEDALDEYLAGLLDKSLPNYHKWLTPEQFGKFYGPGDSEIATLVNWLESRGLQIEQVSPGRTNIAFSGTVAQLEEAFRTQIHLFNANGEQFFSNATEPSIPTDFAQIVKGIAHLDTLRPRPYNTVARPGKFDTSTKRMVPLSDSSLPELTPELTISSGGTNELFVTAADAATIYDSPNTFNGNFSGSGQYEGFGVSIGIGGDAIIQNSTFGNYSAAFLNGGSVANIINVDGVTSTVDSDEAYIDTELAEAMAPRAAIYFYTSTDLFSAIDRALSDNLVDIFSLSFGECELNLTTAGNAQIKGWWQQAAAQGIAVTIATGDSGSAGCDPTKDTQGNNVSVAKGGLNVSGFASTPYNVAVGGTDFYALNGAFSTYVSTTADNPLPGYRSALKYIPESTWNDSTTANLLIAHNAPLTGSDGNIVAGSGGTSSCSANTSTHTTAGSCSSGYAKPSWQQGIGVPADSVRDLPDVSLMAGNGVDEASWLVCTDETFSSGGKTYTANCASTSTGFAFSGFGGTSAAAPAFAGILALVQSATKGRLGQAAPELYELYNGSHSSSIFHDITVGNNSVPCTQGSPNCSRNANGFYYEAGYETNVGFDLATGLGSVDAGQLVAYWGSATGSTKPTLTLTPSATTIDAAQQLTVTVSVSGNNSLGTPTGTVTLSGDGYTSSSERLSGGSYVFTISAGTLTVGSATLTANYGGDTNYAAATASTVISITGPSVRLSPTSLSFPNTAIGSSSVPQVVTMKNVGTEALTISGLTVVDVQGGYQQTNDCGTGLAVGAACTISVTFAPIFKESLPASLSIMDNAANSPQFLGLSGTSYTPAPAVTLSSTGLTFPSTHLQTSAPSQTVTVTNSGTATLTVTSVTISGPDSSSYAETNTCGTVAIDATCLITVTFTPTSLGTLTAILNINDNGSDSPQTLLFTGSGTEVGRYTLSASAVTMTPGSSGISTITVSPLNGYSGTIILNSCSNASAPTGAVDIPTCSITNATITVGSSSSNGIVTFGTTAASSNVVAAKQESARHPGRWVGTGGLLVAGILLLGFPVRGRTRRALFGIFFCFGGLVLISGCGGGGNSHNPANPGTTRGSYSYSLTGTDANGVKQTATISVMVT